jgi:hypothetical protein
MDIGAWLRGVGLERYEQAFCDNEIDRRILPGLTADDLRELRVGAIGHRALPLNAIADLPSGNGRARHSIGPASPPDHALGSTGHDRRGQTSPVAQQGFISLTFFDERSHDW